MPERMIRGLAPYTAAVFALIAAIALSGCSNTTLDTAKIATEDAFASISNLENDSAKQTDELITAQNAPAFASLLETQDPTADQITDFISAYQGQAVEFDACVTYLSENKQAPGERTLNDIELVAGDSAENAAGPVFRLNNVNISKTAFADAEPGQKVDLIATVMSYDSETGDIVLSLVSVSNRS